jgi:PKD repeat protein
VTVNANSGRAPLAVTADASRSTDTADSPIQSYQFNVGDGTVKGPQPGATATHTYTAPGTHTVTVTVTDTAGQSSTATAEVTVFGNFMKNAGFETDLSGWNTAGSGPGIALSREAGGDSGNWAAKPANTGTTASSCVLNDAPNAIATTANGTYTATL